MVHIPAPTHLFKCLLERLFGNFSDDCEAGETVIETLGVVCDLERAKLVALGELCLDSGGDEGGGKEGWGLWAHCRYVICGCFVVMVVEECVVSVKREVGENKAVRCVCYERRRGREFRVGMY